MDSALANELIAMAPEDLRLRERPERRDSQTIADHRRQSDREPKPDRAAKRTEADTFAGAVGWRC